MYLQKYVKEHTGKELSLILDCRTRWNSLLSMMERFYKLKECIDKALIDVESEIKFSDIEWSKIKDLIDSLQPFKLAVEALCRRDSTLLTAETTLKFVSEKLLTHDTVLSNELYEALHTRIKERRTIVTGILIYLQNPKKYLEKVNRSDYTFTMPKKKVIRSEMTKILERVIQEDTSEEIVEENLDSPSLKKDLTLQEELQLQIQQEATCYSVHPKKEKDFDKVLKKEMTTFESDGVRGEYLSAIHDYLLTIKPTSVEAERAFSAAGYICSSIRMTLDLLTYFVLKSENHLDLINPVGSRRIDGNLLEFSPLEEHYSVDEAMIPYYGRHGCKQHIKGKPIRYGFKAWVGATRLGIASNAVGINPKQSAKRFSQSEKRNIVIEEPHMVSIYNKYMGGVDRSDENISHYRIGIRGKKWYMPLLTHMIVLAEHNAWQLYNINHGKLDHLGFRRRVTIALIESNRKNAKRGSSRPSHHEHADSRKDQMNHLVIPQSKQTHCRQCHKKCLTRCKKCDVGVCVKCFETYHS
ncbi:unnamed protein product [Pieris macdunnoughi]|uniref:PiggyBac transposable element-derived protein domain-containing protein n=1 Tax=Pieris macdunnoughi TaxID=345717 RepID=A0A821XQ33_9NEOP|nr:unnamed protein product [Pieris macdunnoughi]